MVTTIFINKAEANGFREGLTTYLPTLTVSLPYPTHQYGGGAWSVDVSEELHLDAAAPLENTEAQASTSAAPSLELKEVKEEIDWLINITEEDVDEGSLGMSILTTLKALRRIKKMLSKETSSSAAPAALAGEEPDFTVMDDQPIHEGGVYKLKFPSYKEADEYRENLQSMQITGMMVSVHTEDNSVVVRFFRPMEEEAPPIKWDPSQWERVESLCKDLRGIAIKHKVPVWAKGHNTQFKVSMIVTDEDIKELEVLEIRVEKGE